MTPAFLLLIYCGLIVLASLAGGWLPSLIKLTHIRMQLTMSLVSGIMLGAALLHMLPQAAAHLSISWVAGSMLCGLLVMFFLLRIFHVHDHAGHGHHHEHGHEHSHEHKHGHQAPRPTLSWIGLFFGLAVHTLLDGVALSASVLVEAGHHHSEWALLGLGTFLAVALHKPLDALAITSLMQAGGWPLQSQTMINCGFALACPLGALLFWFGASELAERNTVVGCALGFSAGFFLCIALGDLLPEVQFHSHDRVKLSAALLLGVALAIGVESSHSHEQEHHQDKTKTHDPLSHQQENDPRPH